MASGNNLAPIIIKKVKKGGGHGHHGGAWKVAYADFVTAMMAFFLLLWLIASTSEEQRQGIADYFTPTIVSDATTSGSGDILGGQTLTTEGSARDSRTPMGIIVALDGTGADGQEEEAGQDGEATAAGDRADPGERSGAAEAAEGRMDPGTLDDASLDAASAEREAREFAEIERQLRNAIASVPELNALAENLLVDQTPEGLRIQLVDRQNTSMFASGSALPLAHTRSLLSLVADAVKDLPNQVAIKGHTDATPFRGDGSYSNWELSSDRAHASRRAMAAFGLPAERVAYVVGKADREPLNAEDPYAPVNRRISIVLLRDGRSVGETQADRASPPAEIPFEAPSILQRSDAGTDPYANDLRFGGTRTQ